MKSTPSDGESARALLVLVDGSSYLYRAYHAMPQFNNSRGEPTGAVYGVTNMLRNLLKEYTPDMIAVVFDAKGRTFRDDLFEAYKAHRPPMPDDLSSQIEPLKQIVSALGLACLCIDGVEADDVIGTLATHADQTIDTLISTGDKDMAQLVAPHVTLLNTMTQQRLDRDGVIAKFGVPPERIVDYLALIGDTSDNIPGIPGVGPKTAAKWLQEYGTLDEIVAHAADIKGKIGEKLRAHLDRLPLARELATIRCNVALDITTEQMRPRAPDRDALRTLYQRLEFKRWLGELLNDAPARPGDSAGASEGTPRSADTAKPPPRYETILDRTSWHRWLARLSTAEQFSFDTETTSLDYMQAEIVGVSFALETGSAAYVPLAHDYAGAPAQLPREEVLAALKPLLENPAIVKVGQNLKYDMSVLARYDIHLDGVRYDTMLESYVLNSTASQHDMDSLALKYLAHRTVHYEDIAGKGGQQRTFNQIEIEQAAPYAAEDADIALRLHETLWPKLEALPGLRRIFRDMEMPLVPVLSRMERHGVLIDTGQLKELSAELNRRMEDVEAQAYEAAGGPFNLGSPKQIQEILFERLQLRVLKKTPKGQPSTAEPVLQELAIHYPLPQLILDHRALSKLKSTYADKLPELLDPETGRVHTSYHQAVAATGRLSSSNPNLQNIPVRSPEGRRVREAFVAPPGHCILSADYSQIELRILAHLSQDRGLLAAFNSGEDIHRATAAEIFATPPEQVTAEQRRSAKAINFGLIYGMSAFGLGRQLGIDLEAASQYMDVYFTRYPDVKQFMDETREAARRLGYVETLFGRRLYLPEIHSSNRQRRQYAERAAINAPMQGTAADIIKLAMIRLDATLRDAPDLGTMIMQVHDELVVEAPLDRSPETAGTVREAMSDAASLSVPLEVDVGTGPNWGAAH